MHNQYNIDGYLHIPQFFTLSNLLDIETILRQFHAAWMIDNQEVYQRGAINSHSITSGDYLKREDVRRVFEFITQPSVRSIIEPLFPHPPKFLNTQLFFDPCAPLQRNYWHRDVQYTGLGIAEQQAILGSQTILHCRIPLTAEHGIELVPGSHRAWDTDEEFAVRMQLEGKTSSDALTTGRIIPLEKGDVLIFSANMIHRGLYGKDRFAFDIIYCDNSPDFLSFRDTGNLPTEEECACLSWNTLF